MDSVVTAVIGIACIALGLSHRKGNLRLLHSYHRNRVSEQDRLPFGKLVGLGVILVGIALLLMAAFSFAASLLHNPLFLTVGNVLLIVGLVAGLGLAFYAMLKYNKGIF